MPRGLIPSFTHRAWWWVFGLFIATPALVLALLGLQAIRAREIEREQGLRDQQGQLATLVDSALASALDRVTADALVAADEDECIGFEIDEHGVISFPRDRVFFGPFGAAPTSLASPRPLSAEFLTLVDEVQKEFEILALLLRRAGEAITRDEFLDAVWGKDVHVTHRTVDTHMSSLRRKLEDDPDRPAHIIGVRGVGYRFEGTSSKP